MDLRIFVVFLKRLPPVFTGGQAHDRKFSFLSIPPLLISTLSPPWFLRSAKVISISGVMTVLTAAEKEVRVGAASVSVLANVVNANRIDANRLMIISPFINQTC